jgi:hypothetical protein
VKDNSYAVKKSRWVNDRSLRIIGFIPGLHTFWRYSVVAITTDSDLEMFSVNPGSNPGSAFFGFGIYMAFPSLEFVTKDDRAPRRTRTFGVLISPMAIRVI